MRHQAISRFFALPLAKQYLFATGLEKTNIGDTKLVFDHLVELTGLDLRPGEKRQSVFVDRVAGLVEVVEGGRREVDGLWGEEEGSEGKGVARAVEADM